MAGGEFRHGDLASGGFVLCRSISLKFLSLKQNNVIFHLTSLARDDRYCSYVLFGGEL